MMSIVDELIKKNEIKANEVPQEDLAFHPNEKERLKGIIIKDYFKDLNNRNPIPTVEVKYDHNTLFEVKKAYLTDPDVSIKSLSVRFHFPASVIIGKIQSENWEKQRKELYAKADEKAKEMIASSAAEINARHVLVAKMMLRKSVRALKELKRNLTPFEAMKFIVEAVRIERDATGLSKQSTPSVVNIVNQQQAIIEKYIKKPEIANE